MASSAPIVTHPDPPPRNRFSDLIPSQQIAVLSQFELESGFVLKDAQVAYRTWGRLNEGADNAMVICHALTGSSDVEDWWGPLLGPNLAFDPTRYFIFCGNVMGSPYGTSSPVTINSETGTRWGPEFPSTTVRDDVRLQKTILDHLGVKSVAVVIGGSMGGMAVLEWPLATPPNYVRNIAPIATSPRHSAWGISWGEAQRQSIYSDPRYEDGYYDPETPPDTGLAAARMAALLTYRSRDSFERRFGRKEQGREQRVKNGVVESASSKTGEGGAIDVGSKTILSPAERALAAHNDGHRSSRRGSQDDLSLSNEPNGANGKASSYPSVPAPESAKPLIFSAQSYLRYQGDKFVSRFDANCYIHLTRKMDAHDVSIGRPASPPPLSLAPARALVIAISSDGLFTMPEQYELAESLPDASLVVVDSPEGHDGFLTEFEQINRHLSSWLRERLPEVYEGEPLVGGEGEEVDEQSRWRVKKESLFGEAETDDIARW